MVNFTVDFLPPFFAPFFCSHEGVIGGKGKGREEGVREEVICMTTGLARVQQEGSAREAAGRQVGMPRPSAPSPSTMLAG